MTRSVKAARVPTLIAMSLYSEITPLRKRVSAEEAGTDLGFSALTTGLLSHSKSMVAHEMLLFLRVKFHYCF
jgi:hypothetical protein